MKKTFLMLFTFFLVAIFSGVAFATPFQTRVQLDPSGNGNYTVTGVRQLDWDSGSGNLVVENALLGTSSNGSSTLSDWLNAGVNGSTATFAIHGQTTLGNYVFAPGGSDNSGLDLYNTGNASGNYEITQTLDGTETAYLSYNTSSQLVINFTSISGTYQYYIDSGWTTTTQSNPYSGAGFNDGTEFLSGAITGVSGDFTIVTPGTLGGGSSYLSMTIDSYDPNYIQTDPSGPSISLVGSTMQTTVQYLDTFSQDAGGVGGTIGDGPYTIENGDLITTADANTTTFTAVPEPATLMLLGLGLLGLGVIGRKKVKI